MKQTVILGLVLVLLGVSTPVAATEFSYQGYLTSSGSPVDEPASDTNGDGVPDTGGCEFRFTAFDAPTDPSVQQGAASTHAFIGVTAGLFTVPDVDFGAGVFNGDPRWLVVEVLCPGDAGFTALSPRQKITGTPYAIHARAPWTTTAANVSYIGGNVGVGTATPVEALDVAGDTRIVSNTQVTGSFGAGALIVQNTSGTLGVHIDNNDIRTVGPGSLNLNSDNANNTRINNLLHVKIDGKVGIGTAVPDSKLQVAGTVTADVLTILAGSDLAERFDVDGLGHRVEPGQVVSIDPTNPGKLVVATESYDRNVAGVVSGAGSLATGLVMGQRGSVADGAHPVALTGRVYVWVDADLGPVRPGDFLTTSTTPGHAMTVDDDPRGRGAIIGKAMTSLEKGRGLVLTLVGLQ
jgi:hypothetical protein